MENQTSPSPEIPSPQKPEPNFLVWIAVAVVTLAIGIGLGLALGKYSSSLVSSPTSSPAATPTETTDPTVSQTPNGDLANWKTYKNEDIDFSFEYPIDAEFREESGRPKYYVVTKSTLDEFQESVTAYSFRVGKVSDVSKNSLYEYASNIYSPEKKDCPEEETYTPLIKTELAGKEAYKYQQLNCYDTNSTIYYIHNGQDILYISTSWSIKYGSQYQNILDQILSTFKFVE